MRLVKQVHKPHRKSKSGSKKSARSTSLHASEPEEANVEPPESSSSDSESETEYLEEKLGKHGIKSDSNTQTLVHLKRKRSKKVTVKTDEDYVKSKSGKKKKKGKDKDNEERLLEAVVFGESSLGSAELPQDSDDDEEEDMKPEATEERRPAWVDDEDDTIKMRDLSSSLASDKGLTTHANEKFTKLLGTPKWAKLDREKADSEDEEMLQRSGNLLVSGAGLDSGWINARLTCTLNTQTHNEGGNIKCVEFHPTSQVALVAGNSGIASIIQVDGIKNPKIQSVAFKNYPISCGHFSVDGESFIVSSNKAKHFHSYDMMSGRVQKFPWDKNVDNMNVRDFVVSPCGSILVFLGKFGNLHLLSARTKEYMDTLKMNGEVTAVCFDDSGEHMYSHGDSGEVYVWDMKKRLCIHKFYDEGCISGSALAMAPGGQYLATGSSSGVVNLYNTSNLMTLQTPTPVKAVMNLVTPVNCLKFNSTAEILAMSSDQKDEAMKLLHVSSMSVFKNFPDNRHALNRVNRFDISQGSGYLATANNKGHAHLVRLYHYSSF